MSSKGGLFTVGQILQWAVLFLGKESNLEAQLLLAHTLGCTRERIWAYPEQELNPQQVESFQQLVEELKKGEPLQYLLGKQNFMGLDFKVNEHVLIPRSDTEVLVEEAIRLAQGSTGPIRILDLCTGSGAIAVSLAKFIPLGQVTATDISPGALQVAQGNAQDNGVSDRVTFFQGDLWEPLVNGYSQQSYPFDIIVSNPPYITSAEMEELPTNVQREPHLALWGGQDGLDFYRRITKGALSYLKDGGYLLLEIGWQQGPVVQELCQKQGYKEIEILKDWSGHDRVVKARMQI